jgi:protein involved in polysaccharide export with SLBB domain
MLKPSDPTIQPDSVLWVSVTEDPSLNGRYVVNNSSAIDFGYVGLVFMQDMTVQQAEAVIKNVLEGRYLSHATVSVKIAKASYDSVGVMGNVEVPGEVKIGPGATITLNDALRRAGGLRGNRDSNRVKIIRGGLRSPFGPAAEGEVLSLVSAKGELQIPSAFLRNNDLAYVFASESPQMGGSIKATGTGKRVILLGEVPRRGIIEFAENEPCTLMYLLFKIGGLPRFARADRIQIVRRGKDGREKTFTVNGESLMKEGDPQNDIVLESGDRVIVPARKIAFF